MTPIRSITTTFIVMTVVAATIAGFSVTPVAAQGITGPTLGADLQNAGVSTESPTHANIAAQAMNVTVPFVENRGQVNDQVAYYATTFYGTVYVTSDGITHSIQDADNRTLVLTEQFVDANGHPLTLHPQGEDPSATVVSSFIGNDSATWQTNLPTFTLISLGEVYPGITVKLRATGSSVEKLFVVAPGANVDEVHVRVLGADQLTTDVAGQLVIASAGFENVSMSTPHAFQDSDVAAAYTVTGDTYGFAVGAYDHTQPLTIDPGLSYSTYLGGSSDDWGNGIAVDNSGNAYVTGWTRSTDFPTTPGAFQTTFGGGYSDAFVTKLNPAGTALVYSTYLGGSGTDDGYGIAIDSSGNAYVTGWTSSANFPTTPGAFQTTFVGGTYDAFVAKLNPAGSALVYSTYLGGNDYDEGYGIAIDSSGNAYVTGWTQPTNFPTTPGAFQTTFGGGYSDAFVTKLNPAGTALVYSTYLGGNGYDEGNGIAVDGSGNAYVTGFTYSANFPTTPGAFQTTFGGGVDAFVTKLNPAGSALVYSTYLGGGYDEGNGIAIDSSGNAYVTGWTQSTNFPTTPGAFQTTFGGGTYDAFVAKLNPAGSALVYSTYLGGSGDDGGLGIAVDSSGNAYVTGWTSSTDFPTTPGAFRTTYGGGTYDAFVAKLNPAGSALVYSTYLGGNGYDEGYGIAIDSSGNAYVTGWTDSTDFPTTPGAFQTTYGGGGADAFVVQIAAITPAPGPEPTPVSVPPTVLVVTGTDGALWWKKWDGGIWSAWQSLGGILTAAPSVTSQANGVIDVFGRGASGGLWQREYKNGAWSDWTSLGGQLASGTGPASCSPGSGTLDVFVTGTSGALWQREYKNGAWSNWQSVGGTLTASPAAASQGSGVIDVFGRGTSGGLWQREYKNGAWSDWTSLGGQLAPGTGPACSWGSGRLDVLVIGASGALWHWSGSWDSQSRGGYTTSSPEVASPQGGVLDVVVTGSGTSLWEIVYSAITGSWSGWQPFGALPP